MARRATRRPLPAGFTLIELLVALSLMALMAVLSWRGLDGMTRAETGMRQHADEVLTLQAALAQWGADLDALAQQPQSASLDWDGRALRLLRRDAAAPDAGLRVVAWARRDGDGAGQWLRWQSPPLTRRADLQQAWQKAALWAQNPGSEDRQHEVRLLPLEQWRIFYHRGGTWSNPLSSAGITSDARTETVPALPDGVRLVLTLPAGAALAGSVTRDWLRPGLGGGQ